jgi:hypothetical protein
VWLVLFLWIQQADHGEIRPENCRNILREVSSLAPHYPAMNRTKTNLESTLCP